jgi:regulator of sigma E protease
MLAETVRNLLIFVALLGSLVFVHELGHFAAAVAGGVKVKEFGLGLPPRLLKLGEWRGTELTLNWIPLGGFVRPEGEYDPAARGGLAASSPWVRLAVFTAGPAANFLAGYLVFVLAFSLGWPEGVRVLAVAENSPAQAAGVQAEDVVLRIDGQAVNGSEELLRPVNAKIGQPLTLELLRGEETLAVVLTPNTTWSPDQRPTGMTLGRRLVKHPLPTACLHAGEQVWVIVRETLALPARLASGQMPLQDVRFTSPVGLKQVSDRVVSNTFKWQVSFPLLQLTGLVSVALGLTNILPIPALDGGRLAFVLIEIACRRRVNARLEKRAHVAGMVALYALMAGLMMQDLLHPLF